MTKNNVIDFALPGEFKDQLTEILRQGAQGLILQAVEAEFAAFLDCHNHQKLEDGRQRIVRHGHLPVRKIVTGIGAIPVEMPRSRDRQTHKVDAPIRFISQLLPPYVRRSKSVEAAIPYLYLKGISSGDFSQVMTVLLGKDAVGFSADTVLRLRHQWKEDLDLWDKRRLESKDYVYLWADGVYFQAPMDHEKQCMLVLIGATPEGKKELVGFTDGYRESIQSWSELLLDLTARGLCIPPKLAIGDGAMGFWGALGKIWPTTRHQRCWVHKPANILNKMPKALQSKAKADLHNIWMAESKEEANKAFNVFIEKYQAKYPKATHCLEKDHLELLSFYDFPAEHWKHIRTTNPIESTFATVKHRTKRSKGCLSRETAFIMVFKLIKDAEKTWRRLDGKNQLPKLISGVKFRDGCEVTAAEEIAA
ncbi:IS256 family transposase [Candidatus Odyssella acanthamoebae]|uniref:Mutator family transposase n=1 Tax=Candidatus Odyssella acanthamoebae TaxID=91604 RepID=A0A077AV19_9PROT|nr:IS256 family transposase [Candidatus Paracaedibacter acanthamoebae]AIK96256.1 transposase [Candidatus Paracaedibacter acanthamoebae]